MLLGEIETRVAVVENVVANYGPWSESSVGLEGLVNNDEAVVTPVTDYLLDSDNLPVYTQRDDIPHAMSSGKDRMRTNLRAAASTVVGLVALDRLDSQLKLGSMGVNIDIYARSLGCRSQQDSQHNQKENTAHTSVLRYCNY